MYDKAAGTGTVEIVTDLSSVDFGLDAGEVHGFRMNVDLRIQVEAIAQP